MLEEALLPLELELLDPAALRERRENVPDVCSAAEERSVELLFLLFSAIEPIAGAAEDATPIPETRCTVDLLLSDRGPPGELGLLLLLEKVFLTVRFGLPDMFKLFGVKDSDSL